MPVTADMCLPDAAPLCAGHNGGPSASLSLHCITGRPNGRFFIPPYSLGIRLVPTGRRTLLYGVTCQMH